MGRFYVVSCNDAERTIVVEHDQQAPQTHGVTRGLTAAQLRFADSVTYGRFATLGRPLHLLIAETGT